MSPPVVQIVNAPINSKFRDEPEIMLSMLEDIKTIKGIQGEWHGVTIEDENIFKQFVLMENYEAFPAFRASPQWVPYVKKALPLCSAPYTISHVSVTPHPPTAALSGPIVVLTTLTVRPDVELSTFTSAFQRYCDAAFSAAGCKGGVWGPNRDDPNQITAFSSWESKDAHEAFRKTEAWKKSSEELTPLVAVYKTEHIRRLVDGR